MKAYILSSENGTVQIGRTVYCVPTKESFWATRKGLTKLSEFGPVNRSYKVPDNSWESAKLALELDSKED